MGPLHPFVFIEEKYMRKLASVQTIWDVQPIEGADRIEVVSVLGYVKWKKRKEKL